MSEIRIEEKKNRPILPWIFGLLLLALVGFGIAEIFDDDYDEAAYTEVETDASMDETTDRATYVEIEGEDGYRSVVNNYLSYTNDMQGEMGLGHEFSHRALTLLANAAAAVAQNHGLDENVNVQQQVAQIERSADQIMEDPYAGTHADRIRQMAMSITEILAAVDNSVYDDRNKTVIQGLRQEAQNISAETLTLNQKEDVRSFLRQARNVLASMS